MSKVSSCDGPPISISIMQLTSLLAVAPRARRLEPIGEAEPQGRQRAGVQEIAPLQPVTKPKRAGPHPDETQAVPPGGRFYHSGEGIGWTSGGTSLRARLSVVDFQAQLNLPGAVQSVRSPPEIGSIYVGVAVAESDPVEQVESFAPQFGGKPLGESEDLGQREVLVVVRELPQLGIEAGRIADREDVLVGKRRPVQEPVYSRDRSCRFARWVANSRKR